MQEWIDIAQTRKYIVKWSDRKLSDLIKAKKIKGTRGGKGVKRLINTKSLRDYLETLSQPMGM